MEGEGALECNGLERELAQAMPRLRSHLARRVCRPEAEELAQETAARALRYRSGFDPRQALWPWLRRVADRVLVDHLRRRELAVEQAQGTERAAPREVPQLETREEVLRLVQGLPEVERDVLLRFHVRGESIAAIARVRGVPAGTIKSHLSRARRRLAAQSTEEERTQ